MKKVKILITSVFTVSAICAALFLGMGDVWADNAWAEDSANCKLDTSTSDWKCPSSVLGNCQCD